jgi:hypothetical protein
MIRKSIFNGLLAFSFVIARKAWSQDVVLQWNQTLHDILISDGAINPADANPGWSTRSIAMMNTAIYDTFQTLNRTHQPFLFTAKTPNPQNYDLHAAVHTAAFEVLKNCYSLMPATQTALQNAYNLRINAIADSPEKTAGVTLGQLIANGCVNDRTNPYDGSDRNQWQPYVVQDGPGKWRPQPGQSAWGPEWGSVRPFGMADSAAINALVDALPTLPALTHPDYTAAFNQAKSFGDVNSVVRTTHMKETGLFWAYDHPGLGPPPVLFIRNIKEIAEQIGSSEADNARLFAQASVAQADAAIAAWDAKFRYHFWRPIGAIQGDRLDGTKGHDDGNPNTSEDAAWTPLGAPGTNPLASTDDFTPPFPAWTSGHATMGGAVFKSLALFYGNNFAQADIDHPGDPLTAQFVLHSDEFNAAGAVGMDRSYAAFTQDFSEWGLGKEGTENTPESENAMSRIYLGIHWIMDQKDGTLLGNQIAQYVANNFFQAVPEPNSAAIAVLSFAALARVRRKFGPI